MFNSCLLVTDSRPFPQLFFLNLCSSHRFVCYCSDILQSTCHPFSFPSFLSKFELAAASVSHHTSPCHCSPFLPSSNVYTSFQESNRGAVVQLVVCSVPAFLFPHANLGFLVPFRIGVHFSSFCCCSKISRFLSSFPTFLLLLALLIHLPSFFSCSSLVFRSWPFSPSTLPFCYHQAVHSLFPTTSRLPPCLPQILLSPLPPYSLSSCDSSLRYPALTFLRAFLNGCPHVSPRPDVRSQNHDKRTFLRYLPLPSCSSSKRCAYTLGFRSFVDPPI